jgi:hypothetical protein
MNKTRGFAIAVAVLLAATYYFEFYRVSVEEKQKEVEYKLVPFAADQIHQITVENESGQVLLKRDADGWRLEEPVKDWADNSFADDFIEGLANEKALEVAATGDSIEWSVFGLDKNAATVTFTNQKGEPVSLKVSDKKNFEGNSFLRRNQENKVFIASSQWAARAKGKAIDFRDKRLFRGKISAVDEISIHSQKDAFKLLRKEAGWSAEKDPALSLDQNRVREILTSLNETRAAEYIDTIPAKAAFRAQISLKMGDKHWSAELRQTDDKTIYATTAEPAFLMKMVPGQSDKLFEMTLLSLRNRKEPFDFKNLAVQKIEIQSALKTTTLVKASDTWKVEGDAKAALNPEAVKNLITRLSETAVTEYLLPQERPGFKSPSNKLSLKDEKQNLLLELSWGPTLKKKSPTGEKSLILAKSSLYSDPFGLDPSVIESWGIGTLFLQSPLPTEKPKDANPAKEVQ